MRGGESTPISSLSPRSQFSFPPGQTHQWNLQDILTDECWDASNTQNTDLSLLSIDLFAAGGSVDSAAESRNSMSMTSGDTSANSIYSVSEGVANSPSDLFFSNGSLDQSVDSQVFSTCFDPEEIRPQASSRALNRDGEAESRAVPDRRWSLVSAQCNLIHAGIKSI